MTTTSTAYVAGPAHKLFEALPVTSQLDQIDLIDYDPSAPHTSYFSGLEAVFVLVGAILIYASHRDGKKALLYVGVALIVFALVYSFVNI